MDIHVTPEQFEALHQAASDCTHTIDGSCDEVQWIAATTAILGFTPPFYTPHHVIVDWSSASVSLIPPPSD